MRECPRPPSALTVAAHTSWFEEEVVVVVVVDGAMDIDGFLCVFMQMCIRNIWHTQREQALNQTDRLTIRLIDSGLSFEYQIYDVTFL